MSLTKIVEEDEFRELSWTEPGETHTLWDHEDVTVKVLANQFVDSRRWVEVHFLVWEEEGKLLGYYYERPSTEYQEGSESDYNPAEVFEVEGKEVTITKYKRKKTTNA